METNQFQFHDRVLTPNGPGTIQGRLVKVGEPDRILVSHKRRPEDMPKGVWALKAYLPEQLKKVQP